MVKLILMILIGVVGALVWMNWNELRPEVNAIPAWLVIDGDGHVDEQHTGSPGRHDVQTAKTFLAELSI